MRLSRGFSIIEIAVSLFILAAILLLIQAAFHVIPLGKLAKDRSIALRAVTEEVEALRGAGYAALPPSGSFTSAMVSQLANGIGTRTVTVYNSKTKSITVRVTWTEAPNATPYEVELTTLVTETGGLP